MTRSAIFALLTLSSTLVACNSERGQSEPLAPAPELVRSSIPAYSGFAGPERVLYDAARDRYLVSNVNGETTAADDNGFISLLSPDGTTTQLKWIEGGQAGVTLHAPKGLAIVGSVLYVADVDGVHRFDADSGAPLGIVEIPGSTFLNGLSASADGRIYVSDSGPPQGTLDGVGTEAVYVIEHDVPRQLIARPLGRPTSVDSTDDGVLVASYGSTEVYQLSRSGKKGASSLLPAGGLAGVVKIGDWIYVTSWQASAIFRGRLGHPFEQAIGELTSPTDLGFDSVRERLLVPNFTENTVEVLEFR